MILLDTNVVSELRRAKAGRAHPRVAEWAETFRTRQAYLSVITIFELEKGTLLMERRDPSQGRLLRDWLEQRVLKKFAGRILSVDIEIARRCAAIHVPNPGSERDAMIAATALKHGMPVATRNVADFKNTGVELINPWEPA